MGHQISIATVRCYLHANPLFKNQQKASFPTFTNFYMSRKLFFYTSTHDSELSSKKIQSELKDKFL